MSFDVFGITFEEMLISTIILIALSTFITAIKDIPNIRYSLWMFTIIFSIVGSILSLLFPVDRIILVLSLYACLYIGKILTGHFIDGIERSPGLVTPFLLIIIFIFPTLFYFDTFLVLVIYLLVNNALLVYRFVKVIKALS